MISVCFAEELREHFSQYGEIESINVKTDPNTGRSRGFAFIVFNNAEAIDKVVAAGEHSINNKKVDPKKAKARHGKIFVGGLTADLTDEDIKDYFGKHGTVSDQVKLQRQDLLLLMLSFCLDRSLKSKCHLTKQRTRGRDSVLLPLNLNKL